MLVPPNFIPKVGLRVGLDMSKELLTVHRIRLISNPGVYKDGGGLRLIVTALARKRWELRISIKGKKRQFGLGIFPEVSLNDARDEANSIRRAARDGIDLRQQRLKEKSRSRTFREAFETCFDVKRKQLSNSKHLKQWPSTMERYVFPVFGDVPIAEVATDHVLDALSPIWHEKTETAKRILQRIDVVIRSAILHGWRERASPCVGVAEYLGTRHREAQHHRALPWQQVPAFIAMLQGPARRGWPTTRLAFEFLILTATRSSETRQSVWSEFDLDNAIWTIPKTRMGKSLSLRAVAHHYHVGHSTIVRA
jgi:integrase